MYYFVALCHLLGELARWLDKENGKCKIVKGATKHISVS